MIISVSCKFFIVIPPLRLGNSRWACLRTAQPFVLDRRLEHWCPTCRYFRERIPSAAQVRLRKYCFPYMLLVLSCKFSFSPFSPPFCDILDVSNPWRLIMSQNREPKILDVHKMSDAEVQSLIQLQLDDGYELVLESNFPEPHRWLHFHPVDNNASE